MPRKKYEPGDYSLVVRRSSAGLGLFADQDLPKGVCVIEYVGPTISKEEERTSRSKYLFSVTKNKTIDGKPKWNKAGYINHSCRPNCEVEIHKARVFIFSRKAIKAGEELTYDYGKEYYDEHCRPCKCSAARHKA